jgi:hypothetical protein
VITQSVRGESNGIFSNNVRLIFDFRNIEILEGIYISNRFVSYGLPLTASDFATFNLSCVVPNCLCS